MDKQQADEKTRGRGNENAQPVLHGLMRFVRFVLVFLFDFPAPGAGETWPHEAIDEVEGEKRRQHIIQDPFLQHQQAAQKQRRADGFGEGAGWNAAPAI